MYILEGIKRTDNGYAFNFSRDEFNDIINTVSVEINITSFSDNVYYFGYEFTKNTDSIERANFIKWLKKLKVSEVNNDITSFIDRPLIQLNKEINLNSISAFIYPISSQNDLLKIIKREVVRCLPHSVNKYSINLVKNLPEDIQFDWESFEAIYKDEDISTYRNMKKYIRNELLPSIRKSEYFSIGRDVKPKYRQFFMNYLKFEDKKQEELLRQIQKGSILLIDDINTSGSTLNEILRIIRSVNPSCTIYIFTLIGKSSVDFS